MQHNEDPKKNKKKSSKKTAKKSAKKMNASESKRKTLSRQTGIRHLRGESPATSDFDSALSVYPAVEESETIEKENILDNPLGVYAAKEKEGESVREKENILDNPLGVYAAQEEEEENEGEKENILDNPLGVYAAKEEEREKEGEKEEDAFDDELGIYSLQQSQKIRPPILLEGSSLSIPTDLTESNSDWAPSRRASVEIENVSERDDKRKSGKPYTEISSITPAGKKTSYKLVGTVADEDVNALRAQARLYYQSGEKVVLGKGNFGLVRLVKTEDGKFLAVKKIKDPDGFRNEYIFLKLMEKEKIKGVLPVIDTITVPDSRGEPKTYQIMPIANLGSGRDLFKHWHQFKPQEREIAIRYLTFTFLDIFANLEKKRIYHTDFKMDNFLLNLTETGVSAYLSDFGAAVHMPRTGEVADFLVSPKSDGLYFPPEKVTYEHGIKSTNDVYRMQEAWRLGLTLLIYIDPELGVHYTQTAYDLVMKKANYAEWLAAFSDLHKELEERLKGSEVPRAISNIVIGLLQPNWRKRLSITKANKKIKKAEKHSRITQVNDKELDHVFGKLLKIRSLERVHTFEYRKERRQGLKHIKKSSADYSKRRKKEWSGESAGFFRSASERHYQDKEGKGSEKKPMMRKLSLSSLTEFKNTATDLLQKMSPRPSSKEGSQIRSSSRSSLSGSQIKSRSPREEEKGSQIKSRSPRAGGSEIKERSILEDAGQLKTRKEGSQIKRHSPREASLQENKAGSVSPRMRKGSGITFHDKTKRKSVESPNASPPTHKSHKKGRE